MKKIRIPERNYSVMSKELQSLHADFNSNKITETTYQEALSHLEKEMFDYKFKKAGSINILSLSKKNALRFTLYTFSIIFMVIGLVLAILPLEKFSFIPLTASIILALVTYSILKKPFAKYLLLAGIGISLFSGGKLALTKDEVEKDQQFEQTVKKSQQEDLKELEGLD